MMNDIGLKYVRYINHAYKRSGTLWESRYKASLINSEVYLLTCMRYIEMNPVRAMMVQHPGDYRWSSYSHNASGITIHIVQSHPIYNQLASSNEERQDLYRELFRNHIDKDEVHSIRDALNQELVLGRDDFKDKIEEMTKRCARPGIPGGHVLLKKRVFI